MPKKVLVVEDNELNMKLFNDLLEANGYQVIQTRDGLSALELARQHRPDLILMDMSLPLIDGWAATRLLKTAPATAQIPIIALTAHAMDSDREKALAAGCDDFDTKPVELERLLEKIEALLKKSPPQV